MDKLPDDGLNAKSLAQLAYENGLSILAAAQRYQAALEASRYGHDLLTYALVEEGLKQGRADENSKDGVITLRKWFEFAGGEVPRLERRLMEERSGGAALIIVDGEEKLSDPAQRNLQHPRIFYRRESEGSPFIVAKPGAVPGEVDQGRDSKETGV